MDSNQPADTTGTDQPVVTEIEAENSRNRSLFIILGIVIGIVIICCLMTLCAGAIYFTTRRSSSSTAQTPPHYGVFLVVGGKLVELDEDQFYGLPHTYDLGSLESISDKKPTILVWRRETQLQYLQFFLIDSRTELTYNATPRNDGVIELLPKKDLDQGTYCLIQGNPLASGLPGWCFKIK